MKIVHFLLCLYSQILLVQAILPILFVRVACFSSKKILRSLSNECMMLKETIIYIREKNENNMLINYSNSLKNMSSFYFSSLNLISNQFFLKCYSTYLSCVLLQSKTRYNIESTLNQKFVSSDAIYFKEPNKK